MKPETIYQIILSILAGEATDAERDILEQWLEESEENKQEYARIEKIYKVSSSKKAEYTFDTDAAWARVRRIVFVKKTVFNWKPLLRYVALIAVVITVGLSLLTDIFKREEMLHAIVPENIKQPTLLLENGEMIILSEQSFVKQEKDITIKNEVNDKLTYETEAVKKAVKIDNNHLIIPHGKTYQVVFADGTRVWLNSESELHYPSRFADGKREVTLIGEAFFEVTENPEQPFIVKTKGVDIEVLGTSFNVSSYSDDDMINTTLIEGSVLVKTDSGKKQILSPSEQYSYNKISKTEELKVVDADIYISWIRGVYIFKNEPLGTIIRSLQRWHQFSVNFEDEQLMHKRYTLEADRDTPVEKLLEVISYTSDVQLEKVDNIINIKRKGKEE